MFTLKQTFEAPELIRGLAAAAEDRVSAPDFDDADRRNRFHSPQSLLFLRIWGVADYFTLRDDLMKDPPPVHVDISRSMHEFRIHLCCLPF